MDVPTLMIFLLILIVGLCFVLYIVPSYAVSEKTMTYSKLGSKGRLGNQLFQISSVIGEAKYNKMDYVFPSWKYSEYFESTIPTGNIRGLKIDESSPIKYDQPIIAGQTNVDLDGYRQSEHYFSHVRRDILKTFKFKKSKVDEIKQKLNPTGRKILGVHYRMGDYLNLSEFQVCTPQYYIKAIEEFKRTRQVDEIILFSDSLELAKEKLGVDCKISPFIDEMDDFIALSQCDYIVMSNSTYSWWAAYLSPNQIKNLFEYNVIAPTPWFAPNDRLAKYNENTDIYRACWKLLDGITGESVVSNYERRIDYINMLIKQSMPKHIKIDPILKAPVFVISMNDTRLKNAYQELAKAGLNNVNHFKAIVGKDQDYDMLVDYGLISKRFDYVTPDKVSKSGTIGCLLSHLIIHQWLLTTDYEYVIIFEDDIVFNDESSIINFIEDSLKVIDKEWFQLNLGSCISKCQSFKRVVDRLYITKFSSCTHAYLISRRGVEVISNHCPFSDAIDTSISFCYTFDEKYDGLWYTVYPSYFYQDIKSFGFTLRPEDMYIYNIRECQ